MVKKEELCDWFKNLPPNKRIDYMCGLLHMCIPMELRFIGTVLEDLAKKDFHCLRDAENKANQSADLSSNNSNSFTDAQLRAKIINALALLNSTNSPCAEIIFTILESQYDSLVECLCKRDMADEIVLMLTMAIHHPAFKLYHRERLWDILKKVEGHIKNLYGEEMEDETDLSLQPAQNERVGNVSTPGSSAGQTGSNKVTMKAIEIKGCRDPQVRRGGPEYRIHTTWSNDEVTEVYMKYRQLQEIHHKLLNKFPEEKKQHILLPVFPGTYSHRNESLEVQIDSLNAYFSQLTKAPGHILNCEILIEPLKGGTPVNPPSTVSTSTHMDMSTTPMHAAVTGPPSSQPQTFFVPATHEEGGTVFEYPYHAVPYRLAVCHTSSPALVNSCHFPVSSTPNSPANSGPSSPGPLNSPAAGMHHLAGQECSGRLVEPPPPPPRSSNIELSLAQLLCLLNLGQYTNNLKEFTFHQLISMSKEDFAKAGLPMDAQVKLRTKLDQLKQTFQDVNGLIDPMSRLTSAEVSPAYPCHMWNMNFMRATPAYPHLVQHPYAGQPGPILIPPMYHHPVHTTGHNSPANSEASSPPPSPLLTQAAGMAYMTSEHASGSTPMGPPVVMMSAQNAVPPEPLAVSDKLLKASLQVDSSGSEEDRGTDYKTERALGKARGRGRPPQQSQSLPMINSGTAVLSVRDEAKMAGLPVSVSATQSHPSLVSGEPRPDGSSPPPGLCLLGVGSHATQISAPAAIVNGFISDPPPIPTQGPAPALIPPFRCMVYNKPAQPTHTSPAIHNSIINMPAFPPQNVGKNPCLSLHSYMAPPIASTTVMGISPASHPINGGTLQPSVAPATLVSEAGNNFSTYPPIFPQQHPATQRILTTMANSTVVITTTQSHPPGPPLSHSPSPVAVVAGSDPAQFMENVETSRVETAGGSPPSHTPPHLSAIKSQTNPSGVNSGTPSPPLYYFPLAQTNGLMAHMPPYFPHHHQQTPQPAGQPFPNGLTPEVYLAAQRFPAAQVAPFLYGNSLYPATIPHSSGQSASAGSGKSVCYNCGHGGHKVADCKESTMENMSNTFRLNFKPKSDSE